VSYSGMVVMARGLGRTYAADFYIVPHMIYLFFFVKLSFVITGLKSGPVYKNASDAKQCPYTRVSTV
jgi:hypothetical protein